MRLLRSWTLLVATAALVLSGCGSIEEAGDDSAAAGGGGNGEQVTLADSRGTEIVLDGPATRVVGLEWNVIEHLVSLGVMPVGVADVEGYTAWVSAEPLDDSVTDVGIRGEPSIDSIAALSPDLVIATDDLSESAITQLEAFVPVLVVRAADASKPIDQMRENLRLVATATGTEDVAEKLLAEFDAALADGAAALEEAGLAGDQFAFADAYLDGSQVAVRPFTDGSLIGAVTEELGLVSAWEVEGDPAYGLGSTDVEGLTNLGDVHFLYITNRVEGPDPFAEVLADNPIWQSLPFVQSGKVYRLPDGIWMFGGPTSMEQYIDAVVAALTA